MPDGILPDVDFYERLRAYVRRRVPRSFDTDDVVQTVMLRLLESRKPRTLASTRAWLLAAARSAVVDLHRARARAGELIPDSNTILSVESEEGSDITECLLPLLGTLDPEDRTVLQRVDINGESQTGLARELSLSASGLKSRVQRARARLREAVLSRCVVERNARGMPVGPTTCKPGCSPPGSGRNCNR